MAQLVLCLALLLIPTALGANVHERCQFGIDAAKQSSKAVIDLGLKLFEKISKPEENLVFSPVSIALGLALVESGTSGESRNEIQRHLSPPGSNQADSSTLYESLQRQLQIRGGDKTSLSIANGFFHSAELTAKPDFINRTKQCFETQVDKAPFKTNTEDARRQVNQWVANKTSQKIPELFKAGQLSAATVAVLANALHFKAPWGHPFQRSESLPFYKFGKAEAQTVSFVVDERRYSHSENDKVQLVEIPYEGASSISFYVLLPKQRDGIREIETWNKEQFKTLAAGLTPKQVILKLPKFTARSSIDLKTVLQQLGVNKIFSDQADFSRMADGRLKVDKAVHEAYIKVNENGTEAAAATGFAFVLGAAPPPPGGPVTFVADHPFLFSIVHKPTGARIFMGKIVSVQQE